MTKTEAIIDKAQKLYNHGHIAKIDNNTYQVKSNSDPNKVYIVTIGGCESNCDCLGFKYSGDCSHLQAVLIYRDNEK